MYLWELNERENGSQRCMANTNKFTDIGYKPDPFKSVDFTFCESYV